MECLLILVAKRASAGNNMDRIRQPARIFISVMLMAAVLLLSISFSTATQNWTNVDLWVGFGLAFLLGLTSVYRLRIAPDTTITLNTSVILTAVLLLDPAMAMIVAGGGALADLLIVRLAWPKVVFEASQVMIQAGLGGLFLLAVGWDRQNITFDTPVMIAIIASLAIILFLVNSLAISTIIGLQSGQSVVRQWMDSFRFGVSEEIALFTLGILGAAIIDTHPWTLPLMVVPGFIIYRSLERNIQLKQQTFEAVAALADIIDIRDPYTADHSRQVAEYARKLAIALHLDPEAVDTIDQAARVHDIGKVVIDSSVLGKPGKLNDEEWEQIKAHPVSGVEVLRRFPLFSVATGFVRHHHERIDGKGYPDGLAGDRIPFGARIIAVADSLDAMVRARPYRPGLKADVVLAELHRQRGVQWDAAVVDALLDLIASGEIVLPGAETAIPAAVQVPQSHTLAQEHST